MFVQGPGLRICCIVIPSFRCNTRTFGPRERARAAKSPPWPPPSTSTRHGRPPDDKSTRTSTTFHLSHCAQQAAHRTLLDFNELASCRAKKGWVGFRSWAGSSTALKADALLGLTVGGKPLWGKKKGTGEEVRFACSCSRTGREGADPLDSRYRTRQQEDKVWATCWMK